VADHGQALTAAAVRFEPPAPGSRRNPHVARAELERWLPEEDISYRWDKRRAPAGESRCFRPCDRGRRSPGRRARVVVVKVREGDVADVAELVTQPADRFGDRPGRARAV
jgi:hypothetical protein